MGTRENIFGMFGGNNFLDRDVMLRDAGGINVPNGAAETPQFMIKSKDLFTSNVDGYVEDSAPCLHVEVGYARKHTYDASGENISDGRLVARTPLVFMRTGSWVPPIIERMTTGKLIEQIEIIRLQMIEGELKQLRNYFFDCCEIVYFKEGLQDTCCFAFNFVSMEYTYDVYDNASHSKVGQYATNFDFEEVKKS